MANHFKGKEVGGWVILSKVFRNPRTTTPALQKCSVTLQLIVWENEPVSGRDTRMRVTPADFMQMIQGANSEGVGG